MRVLLNGKGAILFAVGNVTSALVGVNPGFDNWCSPCNRCVRFATTVASGHATLATKRTLLLTWTGLSPAGSHQLCLAHSLYDLVGERENRWRQFEAEPFGSLEVDHELIFCRLLKRQITGFRAAQDAIDVAGRA